MAIITLDDRISELETERDAIGKVLKRIKREINRLAEQIETGEVTDKAVRVERGDAAVLEPPGPRVRSA